MEVKEVPPVATSEVTPNPETSPRKVKSASETAAQSVAVDASIIEVVISEENVRNASENDVREQANLAIEVVNVAADSTRRIGSLLAGISGLVEQASIVEKSRTPFLEREAGELIEAVKASASRATSTGVRPLAGDKVYLELEETIGRSLELIFPHSAQDAFGIGSVRFSTVESILAVRASIEQARKQFEALQDAVSTASQGVKDVISAVDVAFQNSEAAAPSVRDVDRAIVLTGSARAAIRNFPAEAIGSVGALTGRGL